MFQRIFGSAFVASLLVLSLGPFVVSAQETTFISAGVPIHYVDMGGDGEPVVLIHSFLSASGMWTQAGFGPSDEYRFIAFDMRGHGQSGKPTEAEAYGAQMIADVVALLDALDIEQAHIAGYSMGAEVALKLAVEHPDLVTSLIIGGSGWSGDAEYAVYEQVGLGLANMPDFETFLRAGQPDMDDEMFGFMAAALGAHGIPLDNQNLAALAGAAQRMNKIINLTQAELEGITVPVLGLAGELDPERTNIESLEGVIPNFTLVVIPGTEHLDAILDPMFRENITAFLSDQ